MIRKWFKRRRKHRHFYKVVSSDRFTITWKCSSCPDFVVMSKFDYRKETLSKAKVGEVPGACGKLDKDCTC
jgi:hypothetical protein